MENLNLQTVFELSVSFLAAIMLFYILILGINNVDKIKQFVQKLNFVYIWFMITIVLVVVYHKQLHDLIVDPPKYVFVLGVFTWVLTYSVNIFKEKIEGQKVLTEAIKQSFEAKLDGVKSDLEKKISDLDIKFDSRFSTLETDFNTLKNDVHQILQILQNQNNPNP